VGTLVTSSTATITFSGCSTAYAVSVSGGGSPQISINGGAWTSSGTIYSGQTLQVELTSSGSVSTGLTATVTVNSTTANWVVTTRSATLLTFVTGSTYEGTSLGGLSGADAICQAAATAAGYAGTYKAILSSDALSAASRLTLSYPIVRATDGTTVVASSNLWNSALVNAISSVGGPSVWTGTNANGSISTGNTCSSWTGGTNGMFGTQNATDHNWTANNPQGCTAINLSLYCIQQ